MKLKLFIFNKFIVVVLFIFFLLIFFPQYSKKFNHIHIAMSLTNNYTYPIMVSITSILLNSKKKTFLNFHLLIGDDVEKCNKRKIKTLKRINHNSIYNFYNVGHNFKGWIHGRDRTIAAFYRIILGEIIKNINIIIYLDGDTITYHDLTEMYNLNMKNLYFRGVGETTWSERKTKKKFICDGVMLMNLKLIRRDNIYNDFRKYYLKFYNKGIYYGDQQIINEIFNNKIGLLPPKFGMWIINKQIIKQYMKLKPLIYTKKELIESIKNPTIRHIWGLNKKGTEYYNKPWLSNQNYKIKLEWNYYAKKTGYYSSICQFFKKACIF